MASHTVARFSGQNRQSMLQKGVVSALPPVSNTPDACKGFLLGVPSLSPPANRQGADRMFRDTERLREKILTMLETCERDGDRPAFAVMAREFRSTLGGMCQMVFRR
jgi:hypothetical protein